MSAFETFFSDLEAGSGPCGGRGQSPRKILTKMSAFEAFSSDLEAEPLQGSRWSPQKILTKMSAFEALPAI